MCIRDRIYTNQSFINTLYGQQRKTTRSQDAGCSGTRDTLTISASGKEKLVKNTNGRTHNTNVDKSIDLKSYIASAQKTNQKIIDNAGTQINAKTSEYMSTGKAFRGALTEKYSKLAAEAKTHSNPENYIHAKYFDKSSDYYVFLLLRQALNIFPLIDVYKRQKHSCSCKFFICTYSFPVS